MVAPFRFGTVTATDSVETAKIYVYAALAGAEMAKLADASKTDPELKQHVGVAWRCLAAAGEWPEHFDSKLRPPQLTPEFKDWITAAIALLMFDHYNRQTESELNSRKIIAILFLLDQVGTRKIRAWAAERREPAIIHHWAKFLTEPRYLGETSKEPDDATAYAVVRVLKEGATKAVPNSAVALISQGGTIAACSGRCCTPPTAPSSREKITWRQSTPSRHLSRFACRQSWTENLPRLRLSTVLLQTQTATKVSRCT